MSSLRVVSEALTVLLAISAERANTASECMSRMVKGFGRRPFATVERGAGAGVQKPPKEETAGR
jgi:hypothetical protein